MITLGILSFFFFICLGSGIACLYYAKDNEAIQGFFLVLLIASVAIAMHILAIAKDLDGLK